VRFLHPLPGAAAFRRELVECESVSGADCYLTEDRADCRWTDQDDKGLGPYGSKRISIIEIRLTFVAF
jgi:hypothetical protein